MHNRQSRGNSGEADDSAAGRARPAADRVSWRIAAVDGRPISPMLVLGIETSCDETGLAVYDSARGLLAHELHSQVAMHANTAASCPSSPRATTSGARAARAARAGRRRRRRWPISTAIAYTQGPGSRARCSSARASRARSAMRSASRRSASITSRATCSRRSSPIRSRQFPFVALLVSGGHSQLFEVAGVGRYRLLGDTQGRRRRRGVRQDGEAPRPRLSRRARARAARRSGARRRGDAAAADARRAAIST